MAESKSQKLKLTEDIWSSDSGVCYVRKTIALFGIKTLWPFWGLYWKFKVIKRKDANSKIAEEKRPNDKRNRKESSRIRQIIYSRICILIK